MFLERIYGNFERLGRIFRSNERHRSNKIQCTGRALFRDSLRNPLLRCYLQWRVDWCKTALKIMKTRPCPHSLNIDCFGLTAGGFARLLENPNFDRREDAHAYSYTAALDFVRDQSGTDDFAACNRFAFW